MRVSQQMLFDRYVFNLNTSLTTLMDLNTKAQTQKKINKASDDPTGMTRILDHRDTLRSLEEYKENISTAKGWLGTQDEALMQTSTIITRARELATQAASGTLDDNNREQVSYEIRSLFDQLIGLGNTEFEDNSVFAGNKIDGNAFEEVMWLTTNDATFGDSSDFVVQGSSETTVLVQFYDTSSPPQANGSNMNLSNASLGVRYSTDGGRTFRTDGTVTPTGSDYQLNLPGSGAGVLFDSNATVKVNDPSDTNTNDGTWMWIRPSVQYLGDDEDDNPQVDTMNPTSSVLNVSATATGGQLTSDVTVRIDNNGTVALNGNIEYSYSMDGGINWVTGNVANADSTPNDAVLSVGNGGRLYLSSNGGNVLTRGQMFIIRPRVADIDLDISSSEQVTINGVGKDIFGGIYIDPSSYSGNGNQVTFGSATASRELMSAAAPKMSVSIQGQEEFTENLFEVMGNLIAFTETNNQTGIQQCLENLKNAESHILNQSAVVGGRENRLEVGESIINGLALNEKTLISSIEDADVSELMTELAQQQIIYESVLRSTSMIMQMGLGNFI